MEADISNYTVSELLKKLSNVSEQFNTQNELFLTLEMESEELKKVINKWINY